MVQILKKKKSIIILTYALLFIIIVLIIKKSLYVYLIAFVIATIIFCIIFYAGLLGLIGICYFAVGSTKKAEKYLSKSIRASTSQPTVYLDYAILLMRSGRADSALMYLEKSRDMNRKVLTDQNISITISSCYLILGSVQEAVETLEELINNYPQVNHQALNMLGYAYFRLGDYNKALEITNQAVEKEDTATDWDNLGQIYYKTGDYEKAFNCFKSALSLDNTIIESNYYMAKILEKQNEIPEAITYYEQASKCDPSLLGGLKPENALEKLDNLRENNN